MYLQNLADIARATRTANGRFASRLLLLPRLVVVAVLAAVCFVFLVGCVRRQLASRLHKEVIPHFSPDQQAVPSMPMPGMR